MNAAFETGLTQGILFERRLFAGLTATADKAEGLSAFVEKRQGVWTGGGFRKATVTLTEVRVHSRSLGGVRMDAETSSA